MKYTSPKGKQEIIKAIMDVFNDVQKTSLVSFLLTTKK